MTNTTKYIGLVIVFISIGYFVFRQFYNVSFSQLVVGDITLQNHNTSGQFTTLMVFALSIGAIPLLYLIAKKFTKMQFLYKGLLSYIFIIGCGVLFWQFRIYMLNREFQSLSKLNLPSEIDQVIPIDHLKFEVFLLLGFLAGTMVSIVLLRPKNKNVID